MRELRLWAAAAAGPAVAAAFSALAALRRKRSLHPIGIGYQGRLQVPAHAPARPGVPLFQAGAANLRFGGGSAGYTGSVHLDEQGQAPALCCWRSSPRSFL